MDDFDIFDTGDSQQVSPYPQSAGGAAIDPAWQAYQTMLGFPPQQAQQPVQGQQQATQPVPPSAFGTPPTAVAAASPTSAYMAPAWLGLGISGQKAAAQPVLPAPAPQYTAPSWLQPQQKSGGGGGMGGILGGIL